MDKKFTLGSLVGAFLGLCLISNSAQANNAEALEVYKLAKEAGSCDMFFVVMEDYPGTTAAKLAKISYKDCLLKESGDSNTNASSNNPGSTGNDQSYSDDELEELEDEGQTNNTGSRNCDGYWDGDGCVTNRTYLIQYLQEALQASGCNIGYADGVWGPKTTKAVAAANRQFGTYFRKSNSPRQYSQMIEDIFSVNYNVCECPAGKVLNSSGRCVKKGVSVDNSRGTSLFQVQNVASNDSLNIRSRPTASSSIVGEIYWDGTHVSANERTCRANSVRWVQVSWGGYSGWVAARFLRSMNTGRTACR